LAEHVVSRGLARGEFIDETGSDARSKIYNAIFPAVQKKTRHMPIILIGMCLVASARQNEGD
jgi:hypothetical protein